MMCILALSVAGWSSLAARRAHNPKVVGSNPAPATKINKAPLSGLFAIWFLERVFGEVGMSVAVSALQPLIEPTIVGMGYEFVGIEVQAYQGQVLIRVYVDGPQGITVGELQQVSHQVSGILDVQDVIKQHYHLEVSSPGLDRPLYTLAHYERFVGRRIKLTTQLPINGRRNYNGQLVAIKEDQLLLVIDDEQHTVAFDNVEKARLVPDFGTK